MNTTEFLAKFPNTTRENENVLKDIACPRCGQRESFRVEATIMAILHDDGTDRNNSDGEYDLQSYCECPQCLLSATLNDFFIEGLDDAVLNLTTLKPSRP